MMTAEFMLSKRPVLRFTAGLFFLLKLFSFHVYCIPKADFVFTVNVQLFDFFYSCDIFINRSFHVQFTVAYKRTLCY